MKQEARHRDTDLQASVPQPAVDMRLALIPTLRSAMVGLIANATTLHGCHAEEAMMDFGFSPHDGWPGPCPCSNFLLALVHLSMQ